MIELLRENRQVFISQAVTRGLDPSVPMMDSGIEWLGKVPKNWKAYKIKRLFRQTKRQNYPDQQVLSVYRDYGVIAKSDRNDNHNRTPEDLSVYQLVNVGDLVINKMKAWQGSLGISNLKGITSPDYVIYENRNDQNSRFLHHLLRTPKLAGVYRSISNGIRPDQWRIEPEKFDSLILYLPSLKEQDLICAHIDKELNRIDLLLDDLERLEALMYEYRHTIISAAVTGQIKLG
jgi:type I restriction enzyme S subunit